jgi:C4-dicarboxylate-binding protein DctP
MSSGGVLPRRAFLISTAATALLARTALGQGTTARLSYHWAPDHESAVMSEAFTREANKRLAGKLTIETFPSGQLYSIRQILGALSAGAVEMGGVVTFNQFPAIDKDWNIVQFPWYFESIEHQRKFFTDTPEGAALRKRVLKKTGLVHIAYVPVGPYITFSAKSAMETPESMAGLKARSLAPNERPGFLARKIDVVSLSTEEVFTGLQSGMINTLSTVPTAVKAYGWWEFLKYAQMPPPIWADAELMANGAWFAQLPKEQQDTLLSVGEEISATATENMKKGAKEALDEFVEKHGGKVTVLEGAQLEAFRKLDREKTEPALAKMVSPEILAAARRYIGRSD